MPTPSTTAPSIWQRAAQRHASMPRSRLALWTGAAWRTWWCYASTAAAAERCAKTFADIVRPPGTVQPWEALMVTTWAR
jgi:hypothetical protein